MPEQLKQSEVNAETDPSVAKQYENAEGTTKFKDFYDLVDDMKIGIMGTYRKGVGPVGRSMAIAKRSGPDFLFLANAHSQKFKDLETSKELALSFQDSKQNWVSVTGEATTTSNDDPRISEIWSKPIRAWFGDLGDGVHTGGPEDPRMKLIEVQPKYITYYKKTVGSLGFAKEVGVAAVTGGIAETGVLREMHADEIKQARASDSKMSS